MNWKLLGIEATKDKKIIKDAYRAQLLHTNPEDEPEKFKELRSAYEDAMKYADQIEEAASFNPVDKWTQKLCNLYNDFPSRIQTENWVNLLNEDICVALDTRPLIEDALLRFLMEKYYVPQSVWQILDNEFQLLNRKQELYESYPRGFIDYVVVEGICYPDNFPFDLYSPGVNGKDCDDYRKLYYKAVQSSVENMATVLDEMDQLSERHPYGELLKYLLLIQKGEVEKAIQGFRMLLKAYPQDTKLQIEWAYQCFELNDFLECEKYCRRVLSLRPSTINAIELLAKCLAKQDKYAEAKNLVYQLMDYAGGDQKRIYQLQQFLQEWNNSFIQLLEKEIEEDPLNDKIRMELAWCYLQNDRSNDALHLCQSIDSNYEDQYNYHNLLAKIAYHLEDYSEALAHLQVTVEMIKNMVDDGTKETAERIGTLADKLQLMGSCLLKLDNKQEALLKYEQAYNVSFNNPEILTNMGRVLCYVGDYHRAIEIYNQLTNIMPNAYHGFYLLSQTYFEVGRDREAFEAVNRALELEGGDLGVYLLKMRILLRNGAYEGVRHMLDFLHQNGITDEINTVWCEAQVFDYGENKKDEALELYRQLASRVESGEVFNEASQLYYCLLCLEGSHLDANKQEDREKMLELANKSLSYDKDNFASLDYKAWLLKRNGNREEALEIYHQLESVSRRNMNVEQELAELYYKDLHRDAEKALYYYELLMKHEMQPVYLFYAGTCCRYLDMFEKAEKYFLQLKEMEPDGIDCYNGLAYLYDKMKRYEDSLEQINQIIAIVQNRDSNNSRYYYHKVMVLRRLNRPLEAIAVIEELTAKYGNDDVYREKFNVYCQFGMWKEASQLLEDWKECMPKDKKLKAAIVDLKLYTGEIDEALDFYNENERKFSAFDKERLALLFAELNGDEKKQISILKKKAKKNQDVTHQLCNMAQAQWWYGHYDVSRKYAKEALEKLDELIPNLRSNLALYRSRRAMVLAILGRFDEAIGELDAVYKLPLCDGCNYCLCKDADIFKANIEEVRNNFEKAMELHSAGAENWPDDLDFVSGMRRLLRRGNEL